MNYIITILIIGLSFILGFMFGTNNERPTCFEDEFYHMGTCYSFDKIGRF